MLSKPIAVLGGGNIGHALAADLSLSGYKVYFYQHPQFKEAFKTTLEKGAIEVLEKRTGSQALARIHRVTTDIKEAVSDVQLILVSIRAHGQELFFNTLIPHLKDGQVVVLMTGNFGSLRLRKLLSEKVPDRKVTICETNTMPYNTRVTGPAIITVFYAHGFGPTWLQEKASKEPPSVVHLISALPAKDTNVTLQQFQKLYPLYSPTKNVLVSALNNSNLIGYAIPTVLNAGRIEYANLYLNCEFRGNQEGHTPSVVKVEEAMADEMAAIVRALDSESTVIGTFYRDYFEYCQNHLGLAALWPTLKNSQMSEDVPSALVPMAELGRKLGVATPIMDAIITIASVLNQEDYRRTGRSLETLGLDELNKKQIINLVESGI